MMIMALSIDTNDEDNGIHPKYEPFGMTGMNVAYEDRYFTVQSTTLEDRQ